MAGNVSGNIEDIHGHAATFTAKAEDCKAALNAVKLAAENLRDVWTGQGSESFQNVMLRFHQAGQTFLAELDEIAVNTHMSAEAFHQLDTDLTKAWSGFGG